MPNIISVSLPEALQAMLDAEARRQRRSRSYVVQEAVRAYLDRQHSHAFAAARDQLLLEGLALTPAQRLSLADELWAELSFGRAATEGWARSFDTFDEYRRWRDNPEAAA